MVHTNCKLICARAFADVIYIHGECTHGSRWKSLEGNLMSFLIPFGRSMLQLIDIPTLECVDVCCIQFRQISFYWWLPQDFNQSFLKYASIHFNFISFESIYYLRMTDAIADCILTVKKMELKSMHSYRFWYCVAIQPATRHKHIVQEKNCLLQNVMPTAHAV